MLIRAMEELMNRWRAEIESERKGWQRAINECWLYLRVHRQRCQLWLEELMEEFVIEDEAEKAARQLPVEQGVEEVNQQVMEVQEIPEVEDRTEKVEANIEYETPQYDLSARPKPVTEACYRCEKMGHRYRDCKEKKRKKKISCNLCGLVGYKVNMCPNCRDFYASPAGQLDRDSRRGARW